MVSGAVALLLYLSRSYRHTLDADDIYRDGDHARWLRDDRLGDGAGGSTTESRGGSGYGDLSGEQRHACARRSGDLPLAARPVALLHRLSQSRCHATDHDGIPPDGMGRDGMYRHRQRDGACSSAASASDAGCCLDLLWRLGTARDPRRGAVPLVSRRRPLLRRLPQPYSLPEGNHYILSDGDRGARLPHSRFGDRGGRPGTTYRSGAYRQRLYLLSRGRAGSARAPGRQARSGQGHVVRILAEIRAGSDPAPRGCSRQPAAAGMAGALLQ